MYSSLGGITVAPMPLEHSQKIPDLCGRYNYGERLIEIATDMKASAQWVTLWHEIVHVILTDAGVRGNTLTAKQEEAVCDAIGTHLTAMMLHGSLKVTSPGRKQ